MLALLTTGCFNNEEKTVTNASENQEPKLSSKTISFTNGDENEETNDVRRELSSDKLVDSKDEDSADRESVISSTDENENKDESKTDSDTTEADSENSSNEIPDYQVDVRNGILAQQRLVEVKLLTENPQQFNVSVFNKLLDYRQEVDLFVGLVDSMDVDEIVGSIQVKHKK